MQIERITFDFIDRTLGDVVRQSEATLQARIAALPEDVEEFELLLVQQSLSKWNQLAELQSNLTKDLSELMRKIIQNAS